MLDIEDRSKKQYGSRQPKPEFKANQITPAGPVRMTLPVIETMMDVYQDFAGFKPSPHKPSDEQGQALWDIPATIFGMADGTLDNKIYSCSLDPGIGKTYSLVRSLRRLLTIDRYKDVSVLVCVNRLSEIERIADEIGVKDFAADTSNDDINKKGLGKEHKGQARLLFITHQMMNSKGRNKAFKDIEEFWYQGNPRKVKVWDEAIQPGKSLIVDVDDIRRMLKPLRKKYNALANELQKLIVDIDAAEEQGTVEVPQLDKYLSSLEAREILDKWKVEPDIVIQLWMMSGKIVNIVRDYGRNAAIAYEDTLPDDIKPILVLDASTRISKHYELWDQHRHDFVALKKADKDYGNLDCHICNLGAGKNSIIKNAAVYAQAAADVINSKPDEEVLVIHHKNLWDISMPDMIGALVEGDKARVKFLNWGAHTGTNDYKHIKTEIMVGLPYREPSASHSKARLAMAAETGDVVPKETISSVELGDLADSILQAACRTEVRRSEGAGCPNTELYIFGKPQIRNLLSVIFPGCQVLDRKTIKGELTPKQKAAFGFIAGQRLKIGENLSFKDVREAIGMNDAGNFKRLIVDNALFISALKEIGFTVHSEKGRNKSYFIKQMAGPITF